MDIERAETMAVHEHLLFLCVRAPEVKNRSWLDLTSPSDNPQTHAFLAGARIKITKRYHVETDRKSVV